jgi:hypothetical protein
LGGPSEPDTGVVAQPVTCEGTCEYVAPATYTGPSVFGITWPGAVAACPPDTPFQGIQGPLQNMDAPLFARECLITPNPICHPQGKTCVPFVEEDYRICIHHDSDWPCPTDTDYLYREVMLDDANGAPVTLCCTLPLQKG